MSWWGDMRDGLETAKEKLEKYPKHSLGWLEAAIEYNNVINNICYEGDWESTLAEFNLTLDENNDPPYIEIPTFDLQQVLRVIA